MLQIYEVLHIVSIIFSIVFSYVLKCGFLLVCGIEVPSNSLTQYISVTLEEINWFPKLCLDWLTSGWLTLTHVRLTISGGIEMEYWAKNGLLKMKFNLKRCSKNFTNFTGKN